MSGLLEPIFTPALERLQRFWFWKRRQLAQQVLQQIRAADANTLRLIAHGKTLHGELEKANAQYAQLQSAHTTQTERLAEREAAHQSLSGAHKLLHTEAEKLRQEFSALTARHEALQKHMEAIGAELEKSKAACQRLDTEHRQLQADHAELRDKHASQSVLLKTREEALEQLDFAHQDLQQEHAALRTEHKELLLVQDRYDLVCAILNSQPADNPALHDLKDWLAGDFVQDVQRLELPAKATTHALEQSRAIAQHAELLADAPILRDKFLVAVAGGFSTGKSSFVSSFMTREAAMLLPTGINPVTAIPTYVTPGDELLIQGHTFKGAHMPLSPEAYGELTHDFISEMGFNVKEIMPYVVLQSPMPALQHLAFIDMPGYNPAQSDRADTAADQGIASAALTEADAVIWLLGLDSNGTLPKDDIDFLLEHADANKPLYIVLNKADLRPLSAIQQVVREIRRHLQEDGIECEGISAYSATLGKELFHEGKELREILSQWDHESSAATALHKEFEFLMDELDATAQTTARNVEDARALLKSLQLDFYELSARQEADVGAVGIGGWANALAGTFGGTEDTENRTQRVRRDAESKLQTLAQKLSTERSGTNKVLKTAREHGHELLKHACDAQDSSAVIARANRED